MGSDPYTTFGEADDDTWDEEATNREPLRVIRGNDLHPIPTWYRGVCYRSRLEARWALFFDGVAIPYRHEDQPYGVDGEGYLPDFRLTDRGIDVEVKKNGFVVDGMTVRLFQSYVDQSQRRLLLVIGWPDVGTQAVDGWYGTFYSPLQQPMRAVFAECQDCHRVGVLASGGQGFDRSVWSDTSSCRCRVAPVVLVGPKINAAIATIIGYDWGHTR